MDYYFEGAGWGGAGVRESTTKVILTLAMDYYFERGGVGEGSAVAGRDRKYNEW
jgi:hypothetical protein